MNRAQQIKKQIELGEYRPDTMSVAVASAQKVLEYRKRVAAQVRRVRAEDRHLRDISEALKS